MENQELQRQVEEANLKLSQLSLVLIVNGKPNTAAINEYMGFSRKLMELLQRQRNSADPERDKFIAWTPAKGRSKFDNAISEAFWDNINEVDCSSMEKIAQLKRNTMEMIEDRFRSIITQSFPRKRDYTEEIEELITESKIVQHITNWIKTISPEALASQSTMENSYVITPFEALWKTCFTTEKLDLLANLCEHLRGIGDREIFMDHQPERVVYLYVAYVQQDNGEDIMNWIRYFKSLCV